MSSQVQSIEPVTVTEIVTMTESVPVPLASRSIIRNREFRRFWSSTSVSLFGSEITQLALPLLAITTLHATAAEVGWLRGAQFLPFLVATMWAGSVIDRRPRRPLMIAADVARLIAIGTIPVLVWSGASSVWWILPLVFIAGVATVVHEVASYAYLPTLVGRERLVEGNGWIGASQSAAQIGGKGIGGLLVSISTPAIGVLADAGTYLLSAFGLSRIEHREDAPTAVGARLPNRIGLRQSVRDNLSLAVRHPLIRPLLGEATVCNFFAEVFTTGVLIHAARSQHMSAFAIGAMFAIGAVGATLGALLGSRVSARFGFGRTMTVAITIGNAGPLASFAVGSSPTATFVSLSVAMFVFGTGAAIANVHGISLRQAAAPNNVQARLNSGYRLISWGAISFGAFAGGLVAGAFGGRAAMWMGAIGMQLAALCVIISPIPRLRDLPSGC